MVKNISYGNIYHIHANRWQSRYVVHFYIWELQTVKYPRRITMITDKTFASVNIFYYNGQNKSKKISFSALVLQLLLLFPYQWRQENWVERNFFIDSNTVLHDHIFCNIFFFLWEQTSGGGGGGIETMETGVFSICLHCLYISLLHLLKSFSI